MNMINVDDKVLVDGLTLAMVTAITTSSRDGSTAQVQYQDGSRAWHPLYALTPYKPVKEKVLEKPAFKVGDKVISPKGSRGKVVEIDDEVPAKILVAFEHDGFLNWFKPEQLSPVTKVSTVKTAKCKVCGTMRVVNYSEEGDRTIGAYCSTCKLYNDHEIVLAKDKPVPASKSTSKENTVEKPSFKVGDDVVVWGEKVGVVKLDDKHKEVLVQRANGTKFTVPLSYMTALPKNKMKNDSEPAETERVDYFHPTYKDMWRSRDEWRTEANKLRDQVDLLGDVRKRVPKGKYEKLVRRVFDLEAELRNMTKSRDSWMKGGSIHQQTIISLQEELSAARGGSVTTFKQLQEENRQLRQTINLAHDMTRLPQRAEMTKEDQKSPSSEKTRYCPCGCDKVKNPTTNTFYCPHCDTPRNCPKCNRPRSWAWDPLPARTGKRVCDFCDTKSPTIQSVPSVAKVNLKNDELVCLNCGKMMVKIQHDGWACPHCYSWAASQVATQYRPWKKEDVPALDFEATEKAGGWWYSSTYNVSVDEKGIVWIEMRSNGNGTIRVNTCDLLHRFVGLREDVLGKAIEPKVYKPATQAASSVSKDFSANYKALMLMKNLEAKKRAHYAINNAADGHSADVENSVRGCREWARKNHKSFQKTFGEALKGLI